MTIFKNHKPEHIAPFLEALLFVAPEPATMSQLASALGISTSEVEQGLKMLEGELGDRQLRLQHFGERYQLTTAPEMAESVEHLLGMETTSHLSRAALETLAIVAYKQPVTRPQIDAIRGVNSDGVMRSLLGKGLVQEMGRIEGPGRPILYCITTEFLQHFGLNSINDLPLLDQTIMENDLEQSGQNNIVESKNNV
jgi:segregation and condensation protein B